MTNLAVKNDVMVHDQLAMSGDPEKAAEPRSPLRTVLYGALALLSVQPITWAAGLLTTVFVPRFLDSQDLGQYTVAWTLTSLVGTAVSLGLTTSLTRRVAANPANAGVDATAGLVLILGLAIPVAVGLTAIGPRIGLPIDGEAVLPVALATMVASTVQAVLSSVLIGQERHARFAWLNGLSVACTAVAGVAVLAAGGGLAAFMAVGGVVSAITVVAGWRAAGLGIDRSGLSPTHLLHVAREGLPFLGWSLANRLRGDIEIGLLAALTTQQVIGWWGAATRVIGIPIFIPSLITTPLLPTLSRSSESRPVFEQTLRRSLVLVLLLTVPASAMILALAPAIPGLLGWRAEFEGSVPLMMMLSMQMPLVAVGMILGAGLIARCDERRWLVVNGLTTLLSGGGALLAISAFDAWFQNGALGAAVVRVLCELVMVAGGLILLPRGTIDWPTASGIARTTFAGACLVATATWLLPTSIILAAAGGVVTYIAVLLALGVVRLADIENIIGMARQVSPFRRRFAHA